jgi:hypothetical protein
MGQGQSLSFKSTIDVQNQIAQISEANCIQSAVNTSAIKTTVLNSTISGDLLISRVQLINGNSCILRSSLSNELLNDLKNFQTSTLSDEDKRDPLTVLAGQARTITPWGAAADIFSSLVPRDQILNSENNQRLVNQITQQMNASCQNKVINDDAPIVTQIENSKIKGNVEINDEQKVANTSCTIENFSRNFVKNDVSNTQEGTIKRSRENGWISAIVGIIIVIAIIIIVGGLLAHGFHIPGMTGSPNQTQHNYYSKGESEK